MARALAAMLVLWTAACATRQVATGPAGVAGMGAGLAVEEFLRAANANDLDAMARVFGTAEGPFAETKPVEERDQWLFALASVVRHDDFELVGTGIVPGRREQATQINVRMRFGRRSAVVPFVVVRTERWGWLVEQVDVEKITMPPPE